MRISRKLAAVAAFFVIGAAVAGCGSSVSGNSVATVAGNPISLQAYNHWAYVFAKDQAAQYASEGVNEPPIVSSNPTNFSSCEKALRAGIPSLRSAATAALKTDCKELYSSTESQVMSFLIQSYWFELQAHKLGISTSKATAKFMKLYKKQLPTAAKQKAYLAEMMKSSGETYKDIVWTQTVSELYAEIVKRLEKPVNSKAIAAYYATHKSSFGTPESRDLHLIRTKTQSQAQAAYNALKSGSSWDAVAKQYAADASSKADGGALSDITSGEEEAAVNKVIFSASLNQLSGPIKGVFGYYVLQVTKITPATQQSLAKATPSIKSQLSSTEQSSAEQAAVKAAQKAWKSQTKCRPPNYQATYCANYKAPKTTTTTTSTPSTSTTATSTKSSTTTTKKK